MTRNSARPPGEVPLDICVAHISAYRLGHLSGVNRVILSLSSAITSQGVRFVLWCPEDGAVVPVLDVVPIPVPPGSARNVALAARTFFGLVRKRSGFDLIHAHQPHTQSLAALLAGRILGVPSILTLHVRVPRADSHGSPMEGSLGSVGSSHARWSLSRIECDKITGSSPARSFTTGLRVRPPRTDGRRRRRRRRAMGPGST